MKDINVREMMVPIEEYSTVRQDATLREAIVALEKAQTEFDATRYRHRAILVYDDERIVGKISQMDVIKALEPDYAGKLEHADLTRFGLTAEFIGKIVVRRIAGTGRSRSCARRRR